MILQVSAFLSHLAVDHVDDADTYRVAQSGNQPQEVGTVPCKQTSLCVCVCVCACACACVCACMYVCACVSLCMSGEHVLNSNKPQSVCPCSLCDSNLAMRWYILLY